MSISSQLWIRILADIVLFAGVLWAPFWLTLILAVILFFLFENFYEFLAVALLIDLIYGLPEARFAGITFVVFLSGLALFFILKFVKKRLLIHV